MKQLKVVVIVITILLNSLFGDGYKKYAGEFLNLGAGSRILGMAGAGTAFVNDVTAAYWNPAGLTDAEGFQAEFMHGKQFISSIQNNYLGFSNNNGDGSVFGVSILYLNVNNIKDSRNAYNLADSTLDYSRVKLFNTGDYSFIFSYAKQYKQNLSYGINVKLIYRDYFAESAYGLGFDAGLKYQVSEKLKVGLMLRDITSTLMAWTSGEKEFITPSLRFGVAYLFDFPAWNLSLQPAADFNILFEDKQTDSQLNLSSISLDSFWGVEVVYKGLFSVRTGLDDLQRFNSGVGVKIPKLTFHYSFTPDNNELGNIQRISVHLQLDRLFP